MDDIRIGKSGVPLCAAPSNLGSSNVSLNSAKLFWTPGSSESKWEIEYGLSGFAVGSGIFLNSVDLNPFSLNGLMSNTSYDFYIRAICGGTNSIWAGPHTFTTKPAILLGDANCDGKVDVLDIITIVNYIMVYNPEPFCFENADVNSTSATNVLDIIGVVNIIMGQN